MHHKPPQCWSQQMPTSKPLLRRMLYFSSSAKQRPVIIYSKPHHSLGEALLMFLFSLPWSFFLKSLQFTFSSQSTCKLQCRYVILSHTSTTLLFCCQLWSRITPYFNNTHCSNHSIPQTSKPILMALSQSHSLLRPQLSKALNLFINTWLS